MLAPDAGTGGTLVAVPWHIGANANTPFVQESRKLWGADVNWRSATAYDAMQALIAAMRRSQYWYSIGQNRTWDAIAHRIRFQPRHSLNLEYGDLCLRRMKRLP
jgi:ABC-type branched-subunit amino acid transport system substrate-binding protein